MSLSNMIPKGVFPKGFSGMDVISPLLENTSLIQGLANHYKQSPKVIIQAMNKAKDTFFNVLENTPNYEVLLQNKIMEIEPYGFSKTETTVLAMRELGYDNGQISKFLRTVGVSESPMRVRDIYASTSKKYKDMKQVAQEKNEPEQEESLGGIGAPSYTEDTNSETEALKGE